MSSNKKHVRMMRLVVKARIVGESYEFVFQFNGWRGWCCYCRGFYFVMFMSKQCISLSEKDKMRQKYLTSIDANYLFMNVEKEEGFDRTRYVSQVVQHIMLLV